MLVEVEVGIMTILSIVLTEILGAALTANLTMLLTVSSNSKKNSNDLNLSQNNVRQTSDSISSISAPGGHLTTGASM